MQLRVVTRTFQLSYPRHYAGTIKLRTKKLRRELTFQCFAPHEPDSRIDVYRDERIFLSITEDLPKQEARWQELFSPEQCFMIPIVGESVAEGVHHLYGTYLDYLALNEGRRRLPQHEVTTRSTWQLQHPYLKKVIRALCAPMQTTAPKR